MENLETIAWRLHLIPILKQIIKELKNWFFVKWHKSSSELLIIFQVYPVSALLQSQLLQALTRHFNIWLKVAALSWSYYHYADSQAGQIMQYKYSNK